jgi:hypothetical protein
MSSVIQLESRLCPNCDRAIDQWTMKVVVVDCTVGVRCPACHEFIKLTMKGGEYDHSKNDGELETQHPEDLQSTTKEE